MFTNRNLKVTLMILSILVLVFILWLLGTVAWKISTLELAPFSPTRAVVGILKGSANDENGEKARLKDEIDILKSELAYLYSDSGSIEEKKRAIRDLIDIQAEYKEHWLTVMGQIKDELKRIEKIELNRKSYSFQKLSTGMGRQMVHTAKIQKHTGELYNTLKFSRQRINQILKGEK